MGLRRPIRSEKYPHKGLATAQQIVITEQTAAAVVAGMLKRARRNGGPQRPVNESIAPTKPPCARKINQVFFTAKMPGTPERRSGSDACFPLCTAAEAQVR